MTIKLAPRPGQALEVAKFSLAELARTDGFLTPILREPRSRHLAVSTWHRVFFLGLGKLVDSPQPMETALDLGWRFFVHRGDRIVAAIDVRRSGSGGYQPGPLTEGAFVDGTVNAFRKAETLLKYQPQAYEPVLVVAPALHMSGLWLRTASRAASAVLPIYPPFKACEALTVVGFEGRLKAMATKLGQEGLYYHQERNHFVPPVALPGLQERLTYDWPAAGGNRGRDVSVPALQTLHEVGVGMPLSCS